jgi:competence ComEA-like helix-hairpin-helix protein
MRLRSPELIPSAITVLLIALPALGWRLSRSPELGCERPAMAAASQRGMPKLVSCRGEGGPLRGAAALLMGQRLDVNSASARELAEVPGISARLGRLIVAEREQRGPFAALEDLARVGGIGPRRVELLGPLLRVGREGQTPCGNLDPSKL